ncbi:sensor histidine kinase [Phaeocystidibacter luteus]|uniref:Signal transduction histidine kinase internal region domain-containing protein n=1 Tax=Phaeocystidibacter luteus TaxID=911197 RepID=A0A6N6RKG7_9FLAO|nr:histidine kinase [Phaeocystidibacter luteus]KAB2806822.1 hypothetical protein F8C67_13215 [Phaeocystidibacter luteus]
MIRILIGLLLSILPLISAGQDLGAQLLGPDFGLVLNDNYFLQEDNEGRMFVASDQGVFVIQGNTVTQYTTIEGLPDNTVFRLYLDHKGRIWALTYMGGIAYFEDDQWIIPPWNDGINRLKNGKGFPYKIWVTPNDQVLFDFLREDDVFYYAGINDTSISTYTFPIRESYIPSHGISIGMDAAGTPMHTVYIHPETAYSTWGGPMRPPFEERSFHIEKDTIRIGSELIPIHWNTIHYIGHSDETHSVYRTYTTTTDETGGYYMSYGNSLWYVNANLEASFIRSFGGGVLCILLSEGSLFLGVEDHGVYMYNVVEEGTPELQQNLFPTSGVSDIYRDHDGALWIALTQEGVYRIKHPTQGQLVVPSEFDTLKFAYPSQYTDDSLFLFAQDHLLAFPYPNEMFGALEYPNIYPLKADSDWKRHYSTVQWNGKNARAKLYELNFNGRNSTLHYWIQDTANGKYSGWQILSDLDHSYRVGDTVYFTSNGAVYKQFKHQPFELIEKTEDHKIEELLVVDGKLKWAFSSHGISRYAGGRLIPWFTEYDFANTRVLSAIQTSSGWIGAATKDQGLLLFQDDSIFQITDLELLPSNSIRIVASDSDRFYAVTNNHFFVARVNENGVFNSSFFLLSELGGLETVDAIIPTAETVLLQSGMRYVVLPNRLLESRRLPSGFSVTIDSLCYSTSFEEPLNVDFKRGQNSFNIQFVSAELFSSDSQLWRYKLDDSDGWRYTSEGNISLERLPPGAYSLQVQLRNSRGIWSEVHRTANFSIVPLLTETWWFWFVVFSPAFIFILIIVRNYLHQRRLSQELISSNMSSLKMQINPHFIFNSFNSIQYLISKQKNDTASEYLSRLAKLIRANIERPELHRISLEEELDYVSEFLSIEALRLDGNLEFTIEVDKAINVQQVYIPPMILQPILENSVWHGVSKKHGGGKVSIQVQQSDSGVIIHLKDDGDGFPREKWNNLISGENLRGSLGLKNVLSRLELLSEMHKVNYTLSLAESETGTHFILSLAT